MDVHLPPSPHPLPPTFQVDLHHWPPLRGLLRHLRPHGPPRHYGTSVLFPASSPPPLPLPPLLFRALTTAMSKCGQHSPASCWLRFAAMWCALHQPFFPLPPSASILPPSRRRRLQTCPSMVRATFWPPPTREGYVSLLISLRAEHHPAPFPIPNATLSSPFLNRKSASGASTRAATLQ